MHRRELLRSALAPALLPLVGQVARTPPATPARTTTVSIAGEAFHINGAPTYPGRTYRGHRVEGLLMNSRMVQATFDDRNPETRARWAYPDTGTWDPDRNTREFLAAMPEWRRHGLLAFTVNLQGGSPEGYSKGQPWHNSAFEADGSLRDDYLGPAAPRPRRGRPPRHGRDRRVLLLRTGPAAARRGGGASRHGRRHATGCSTAAGATSSSR